MSTTERNDRPARCKLKDAVMLNCYGERPTNRGTLNRRDLLQVGSLSVVGLMLPDVLRLQATAAGNQTGRARDKSVIMIWMRGGPSHIDSFDMKPDAPAEIRGEFRPIQTKVPGIEICEYMPLVAGIMDHLAIVRGIRSNDLGDHTPHYILTGSPNRGTRPAFGAIVSHLKPRGDGLPPYVSLMYEPPRLYDNESPLYLGSAHRPFAPKGDMVASLRVTGEMSLERLRERHQLLRNFDALKRDFEHAEAAAGLDTFNRRALEMIASNKAREAFDLSRESEATRNRYGKYCENFLIARRLVEAGVPVVTLKVGDWDTHEKNFIDMRAQLPQLDRGFHALVSDLHARGLDNDVAVVLWGEFGRAPRISRGDGRDHWPEAGAAVLAGGGFKTGQVIGATDSQGARASSHAYTPANIMANLYRHLGIDPATTLPDRSARPIPLLDDPEPVTELG
ncbi:MAG TPA: DUF1501 domain-containing protein [Pirellulales bacterium]|nr:DUF1501 domain-containing protein [Pirellulales bacterium]